MNGLLHASWLPVVGWALLHSLWEGTLVVLAAALLLRGLRGASPRLRYTVAVLALLLMTGLPLRHLVPLHSGTSAVLLAQNHPSIEGPALSQVLPEPASALRTRMAAGLERAMPWVVAIWAVGVFVSLLRLAGGWAWLQRLRWKKAELAPDALQGRLLDLCRRAGLKRAVTLLMCEGLVGPSVVGILRPAILVPAGWFLNLPPAHVEALLAHELAHVLRHDYAVNLLQSLLEVVLFYHPGVWWLSRRIRAERELACDTFAVRLMGDALPLAEALTTLERRGLGRAPLEPAPAPAAHGGSLMERISHLLLPPRRTSSAPAFGAMAVMAISLTYALQVAAQPADPRPVKDVTYPQSIELPSARTAAPAHQPNPIVRIKIQDQGLPQGYRVEFKIGALILGLPLKITNRDDLQERILSESIGTHEVVLHYGQTEGTFLDMPLKSAATEMDGIRILVGLPTTYTIYDQANQVVRSSSARFHANTATYGDGHIVLLARQNGLDQEGKPDILVGTKVEGQPLGMMLGIPKQSVSNVPRH